MTPSASPAGFVDLETGALGHLAGIAGRDGAAECRPRAEQLRKAIAERVLAWAPVGLCDDNADHLSFVMPSIVAETGQDLAAMGGVAPELIAHAGPFDGFVDGFPARYGRWQHTSSLGRIVAAGSVEDAFALIASRMARNMEMFLADLAVDHLGREIPDMLRQVFAKADEIRGLTDDLRPRIRNRRSGGCVQPPPLLPLRRVRDRV